MFGSHRQAIPKNIESRNLGLILGCEIQGAVDTCKEKVDSRNLGMNLGPGFQKPPKTYEPTYLLGSTEASAKQHPQPRKVLRVVQGGFAREGLSF